MVGPPVNALASREDFSFTNEYKGILTQGYDASFTWQFFVPKIMGPPNWLKNLTDELATDQLNF